MATDHRGSIWPLTSDPLIYILPNFLDMQNYKILFVNLGDPINLSPAISLKSNQFENLTSVQKINDHLLF